MKTVVQSIALQIQRTESANDSKVEWKNIWRNGINLPSLLNLHYTFPINLLQFITVPAYWFPFPNRYRILSNFSYIKCITTFCFSSSLHQQLNHDVYNNIKVIKMTQASPTIEFHTKLVWFINIGFHKLNMFMIHMIAC